MSDEEAPIKGNPPLDSQNKDMISVDLHGKDIEIWEKRSDRFHERITNSIKKIFGGDIPASATANEDLKEAIDDLAESAKQKLKTPQLNNIEKQITIRAKYAELKEREARTRKIELEADKLEMEIERAKVLESQKIIDLLIQRGELVMKQINGETVFIYKKRRKANPDT